MDVAANVQAAAKAEAEEKRKRIEAEQLEAARPNTAEVKEPTGRELESGDFIMPRKITASYVEQDGKFFTKKDNRVAFEDDGKKLSTSSVNKETIADMVSFYRMAHRIQLNTSMVENANGNTMMCSLLPKRCA